MSEQTPSALEATQPKTAFSTLRNIHRRNREDIQEIFFNRKKMLPDKKGVMSDVSKMLTRKEIEGDLDPHTRLLNKNGFNKRLHEAVESARRRKGELYAVVLDADGLKQKNDSLGHKEGDRYITTIGTILTKFTRSGDFVGRTGGDEFIAILENPEKDGIEAWWNRINEKFIENDVRISAGATRVDLRNIEMARHSLEIADQAMYAAKLNKGNGLNNFMTATQEGNLDIRFIEGPRIPVSLNTI